MFSLRVGRIIYSVIPTNLIFTRLVCTKQIHPNFFHRSCPPPQRFSTNMPSDISISTVSTSDYERLSIETLNLLVDDFDELGETGAVSDEYDVQHSYGVLKVNFGSEAGTYVINRQTINKQLWFSSPTSGPKRYDYDSTKGEWVYKYDNVSLHARLSDEVSAIVGHPIHFRKVFSYPSTQS